MPAHKLCFIHNSFRFPLVMLRSAKKQTVRNQPQYLEGLEWY